MNDLLYVGYVTADLTGVSVARLVTKEDVFPKEAPRLTLSTNKQSAQEQHKLTSLEQLLQGQKMQHVEHKNMPKIGMNSGR